MFFSFWLTSLKLYLISLWHVSSSRDKWGKCDTDLPETYLSTRKSFGTDSSSSSSFIIYLRYWASDLSCMLTLSSSSKWEWCWESINRFASLISWKHHRQKWLDEMPLLNCLAPGSQAVHDSYYIFNNFRSLFSAQV